MTKQQNLKNIAIVAHVDHGKTTLVDALLRAGDIFRKGEVIPGRVMDSDAIERERGITILAKNTAINYKDTRINIVDTPGHADFGGEVERILDMVDGVLLLVDAFDGPMPQTRFVLAKALERDLKTIVVINKIDRPDARPEQVLDLIYELYIDLGATDQQIEFPVLYASAKKGAAFRDLPDPLTDDFIAQSNICPVLDAILDTIPNASTDDSAPLQILVSNIDYDQYVGRLAIGRVEQGTIRVDEPVTLLPLKGGKKENCKINKLYIYEGLKTKEVTAAGSGEIVSISGLEDANIGDTICDPEYPQALPGVAVEEPTLAILIRVNDSPFAGQEGKFLTSRHLKDRLEREMLRNVAMHMEPTDSPDCFLVKGRGELHLSILMENMRREGYEFQVSRPHVLTRIVDGKKMEPQERLTISVKEEYQGTVIEKLSRRGAELVSMEPPFKGSVRLEFLIPASQLIGYRSEFMNDTHGNGLMSSILEGYVPARKEAASRGHGVLIAFESGQAVAYGLYNAQERGELFVGPGSQVYAGQIIGTTMQADDVVVNVCKKKKLSNMRSAGSDDNLILTPPLIYSLEQCLEFIDEDELIEVTPTSLRMRKQILDHRQRQKYEKAGR